MYSGRHNLLHVTVSWLEYLSLVVRDSLLQAIVPSQTLIVLLDG